MGKIVRQSPPASFLHELPCAPSIDPATVPAMKRCSKCGETKALREFCPDKRNKDGTAGDCGCCRAKANRQWVEANRERVQAYARQEKVLLKNRLWKGRNRQRVAEYRNEWYERNRQRVLTYAAEYERRPERRAAVSEMRKQQSDALAVPYVRRVLSNAGIPPHVAGRMLELKREQLRLQRLAKELKQAIIDQQEKEK